MALIPGTRLGVYQIGALLGAGGMGEVYRATDTSLGRDVAVKVLPTTLSNDPDRLARFEREAKTLAALNHPHIAQVYGLERSGFSHGDDATPSMALVMELVDGTTLADRLATGAMTIDEVRAIAGQIADALAAAHEQGIVHRDLKPANIKIRSDGTAKVLDFGLAKTVEPAVAATGATQAPTITTPAFTQVGVILGTAAYMAPEQARGRTVDRRGDIWAFGCVLYEMLSGRRAFPGEDVTETLANVITKEPDWTLLPASTPTAWRRLLRRCLTKDPRRRLADTSSVRLDLEEPEAEPSVVSPLIGVGERRTSALWPWAIAFAAVGAALLFELRPSAPSPSADGSAIRSTLQLPVPIRPGNPATSFAISPDGRRLAFAAASSAGGPVVLWLRPLDSLIAQPLAGTEGAAAPFWSPDSRSIAFVAGGQLKRVDATGGSVVAICQTNYVAPGSWTPDGVILFTPQPNSGLYRVSALGGIPQPLTALDKKADETRHAYPFLLPDGRHFLFLATAGGGTALGIDIGSLDAAERVRVIEGGSNAVFVQDRLLFLRDNRLYAQPFDADRRATTGAAVPIADEIRTDINSRAGAFTVSSTGTLVVHSGAQQYRFTWFDRNGRRLGFEGAADGLIDLSLSPDGRLASYSVVDRLGGMDIWIRDIERGSQSRFTADPADDAFGTWSPDGRQMAFTSRRAGRADVYLKDVGTRGDERLLYSDSQDKFVEDWSPDGQFLIYRGQDASTASDLWILPLAGAKPRPFVRTAFAENWARFSPDGRWVAHASTQSGASEVYITSFPDAARSVLVSNGGGTQPAWHPNGRELFYLDGNVMMSSRFRGSAENLQPDAPVMLFDTGRGATQGAAYRVAPDGRFLVTVEQEASEATAPTLVTNWPALLAH